MREAWTSLGKVGPALARAVHTVAALALAVPAADPDAASPPAAIASETRPNIVLVLVDDLGWQDTSIRLGATPSPWQHHWRTPNVERLASEGLAFTHAYASAPVCSPSRIALLTGQAPARHGSTYWILHAGRDTSAAHPRLAPPEWDTVGLEPGDVNLAALLRAAGYRTIHVGKAHLGALGSAGSDPTALGFEVNVAGHGAGAPGSYLGTDGFGWTKNPDSVWNVPGLETVHGQEVWLTDVLADRAVAELERAHAEGEPFFLHFAPYAVHTPIMADPARVGAYAGLPPVEAAYATLIEGVDAALGRVLDALDRLGIAGETLVVFASDNGGLAAHTRAGQKHRQNAPLASGKGSGLEGGVRIPLFVRGPGVAAGRADVEADGVASEAPEDRATDGADRTVDAGTDASPVRPPGRVSDEPIVLHDLFPTLCAAADVAPPTGHAVDGRDLTALLADEVDSLPPRSLLWHQPHFWGVEGPGIEPYSALRRGAEKLIWFHDGERLELYDVVADPGETRDLATERPERVAALAAELVERLRAVGARASIDRATGRPVPWPEPRSR